jgi:hypothetical protein
MNIDKILFKQLPFVNVVGIIGDFGYDDLVDYLGNDPYIFEVCDEMNFEVYEMVMDSLFVRKFGDTFDVMIYDESGDYLKGNYFSVDGINYVAIGSEVDMFDFDVSSMKTLKQELLSDD